MRRKKRRHIVDIAILFFIVIVILAGLLVFRVHRVTVSGNTRHSSEEIADGLMTDFLSENTLFLWWTYKNGDIPDTMPYLQTMKITVKSPFSIRVEVTEKDYVGYLDTGSYAYFDEDGVILEISDEQYDDIPVIEGASLGEITLYQKVPTQSSSQLRTILNLIELLDYQELSAGEIEFDEDSEITVYIGHIKAVLGQDEYLEEKIANLKAVLNTMDASAAGVLHLENVTGKNEDITFSPAGEVTKEDETEESTGDGSESDDTGSGDSGESAGGDVTYTDDPAPGGESADQGAAADGAEEEAADDTAGDAAQEEEVQEPDLMVFNSSGQLVYNVHVRNGKVVDAYGNEIPGCSVNEDGYVVDAYMNIIDPATGDLMN